MTAYLRSWFAAVPEPEISLRVSPPPVIDSDTPPSDEDEAPAFPALNSIQRAPSINVISDELPQTSSSGASSSLMPPPTTTTKPKPKSRKVALAPGHSPLDWARLKSSGADLRGVENLTRVTPAVLKEHNKPDDAWSAFNGKVYNITPYLPFHPGGEKELMRVAGRDGTKLFALTHAWINVEFMLDECLVGFLVPDSAAR